MDLINNPVNFGKQISFQNMSYINDGKTLNRSVHINQNPSIELNSSLNLYRSRPIQTANNFIGIKAIRPPPVTDRRYALINANTYLPENLLLRTYPNPKRYSVIC